MYTDTHTSISYSYLRRGSTSNYTPVAVVQPSILILVSKYHSVQKEILGKMVDSGAGAGKVYHELGTSCGVPRKYSNNGNILKAHRSQLERIPTDKIWDNLSIKINNEIKDYNSLK